MKRDFSYVRKLFNPLCAGQGYNMDCRHIAVALLVVLILRIFSFYFSDDGDVTKELSCVCLDFGR